MIMSSVQCVPKWRVATMFTPVMASPTGVCKTVGSAGRSGCGLAQARILAFSRSNSSAVMTPRSRRSASLASWSTALCDPAASWT